MHDTWYDGQISIMNGMKSAFGAVTCCPVSCLRLGRSHLCHVWMLGLMTNS